MKHFIIEITYTAPFEQIEPIVPDHRAFLQAGYDQGWLLCSGPSVPRTGGMVVCRAPSLEAIQEFFNKDPYRINGVAGYRFVEFQPVLHQSFLQEWVTS